jgi:hypothetical protein
LLDYPTVPLRNTWKILVYRGVLATECVATAARCTTARGLILLWSFLRSQ